MLRRRTHVTRWWVVLERFSRDFALTRRPVLELPRLPNPTSRQSPGRLQQVLELYRLIPSGACADPKACRCGRRRDQIRQVFTNLAKNAIEAMP